MAEPVAAGFCFVFIRSTTAIGFDSSTSGGSLTGKNTSRMLLHSEENTPSSLMIRSFLIGFDSSSSGSSLLLLNASRRFAMSDVHIEPSVSSCKWGASAGRNVGAGFPGSISGGGVNNEFAISCLASVECAAAHPDPLYKNRAPPLLLSIRSRSFAGFSSVRGKRFLAPLTFYKLSHTHAHYLGRTSPNECLFHFGCSP